MTRIEWSGSARILVAEDGQIELTLSDLPQYLLGIVMGIDLHQYASHSNGTCHFVWTPEGVK